MAIVYFPKSSIIEQRDTISGSLEVLSLNVPPNSVFFFDTASNFTSSFLNALSCSYALTAGLTISSSYAQTASLLLGSIESASYAQTASLLLGTVSSASFASTSSFALNATNPITTGSSYPITASVALVSISSSYSNTASFALNAGGGSGTALVTGSTYYITSSNAISSSYSDTSLTSSYVSNTVSSSYSINSNTASYITNAISASYLSGSGGTNAGIINATGQITAGGNIATSNSGANIFWSNRCRMFSPSDGQFKITYNDSTTLANISASTFYGTATNAISTSYSVYADTATLAYTTSIITSTTSASYLSGSTAYLGIDNFSSSVQDALLLVNTASASASLQQYSPAIRLTGQGWSTTNTSSRATEWRIYAQPAQASSNPTNVLVFDSAVAGGAFSNYMTISPSTGLTTFSGNIRCLNVALIGWTGRCLMASPADGQITLTNNATTDFTRLNFGTNTSGSPALAKSGNSLAVQLADGSALTNMSASQFIASSGSQGFVGVAVGTSDNGLYSQGNELGLSRANHSMLVLRTDNATTALITLGLGATTATSDVFLGRDAANVLYLRNATNAPQTFRVYNSGSTTNFSRINYTGNQIAWEKSGSGNFLVTSSLPLIDAQQEWSGSSNTFTGIKSNITDTTSTTSSLLLDLQVNGTSSFSINKTGLITAGSASYALTASFALNGGGDGFTVSASWASSSISASYSDTSSYSFNVLSASYANTCSVFIFSDITRSFTFISQSQFATQSLFATQSITASLAETATTASFALTASYAVYPANIVSAPNNATSSIISILNSIYNSMFVNYVLTDTQNFRAGNIVVLYTTSSTVLTETCTTDIGNNDGLQFSASLSASYVNLLVVNTTNSDYSVKYHYDTL